MRKRTSDRCVGLVGGHGARGKSRVTSRDNAATFGAKVIGAVDVGVTALFWVSRGWEAAHAFVFLSLAVLGELLDRKPLKVVARALTPGLLIPVETLQGRRDSASVSSY